MKEFLMALVSRFDIIRITTAFAVLGSFLFVNYALIFVTIPEGNREIVHLMIGIIDGAVMTVVGYEFGSSKGQQPKQKEEPTPEAK